jgi:hypothetical protein
MWVSIDPLDSADRAVLRIDPDSDRILATIPTSVVPSWEVGGGGLAVVDGNVWVAGRDTSGNGALGAIVRIDSSTNLVVDSITLEGGSVADVAAEGDAIWALISGNPGRPEVVRIDPSSDKVVASIPLSGGYGRWIFAIGGSVLVALTQPRVVRSIGGRSSGSRPPPTRFREPLISGRTPRWRWVTARYGQ